MPEDMSIPWPYCLGTFDEESCRYFLQEVGRRVVPNYPFSFGIEEVYGLVLDRYGYEDTPDVTSLLQELLEDDQNATGLGDDGDVWRSWRHDWRHRNDDARNPFIPRYGALVLRPASTTRVRLHKANNFTQMYEQQCIGSNLEPLRTVRENSGTTSGRLGVTSMAASKSVPESADDIMLSPTQAQDFDLEDMVRGVHPRPYSAAPVDRLGSAQHMHRLSATGIGSGLSLPTVLLDCTRRSGTQLRRGDSSDALTRRHESYLPTVVWETEKQSDHPAVSSSLTRSEDESMRRASLLCRRGLGTTYVDNSSTSQHLNISENGALYGQSSEGKFRGETNQKGALPDVVLATANPRSGEQQLPPNLQNHRRAVHRQARLIDGTIFTSKSRRSKATSQSQITAPEFLETGDIGSSAHPRVSPFNHRDTLRGDLTHDFGHLFRREKQDRLNHTISKYRSVPGLCKVSIPRPFSSISMATDRHQQTVTATVSRPVHHSLGLDGASDIPPNVHPFVDINKPLPLNPEEIVRSMSCRSQKTVSQYSDDTLNLPSTASTTSSVSKNSSRRDFRDMTFGLLQAGMRTSHELPPIHEVETNSRDTVDPPKSPVPPASPVSYTSIACSNPHVEKQASRSPPRPPPLDFGSLQKEKVIAYNGNLTTSSDAAHPVAVPVNRQAENYFPTLAWYKGSSDGQHDDNGLHLRGRPVFHHGATQHTRQENLPPKTPTKRSRSPIKRFLGLTKSSSTNRLEEPRSPTRPKTPGSTTKDSLKKWGDRFRYGFLTPDEEQLRQEQLIEAHNNNSATSTPQTLTPQHSAFPVSLEPPIQAKIQSEIELIMTVTANRYLLRESRAGRLSAESVAKTKDHWEKLNRPQVIEFHYDQLTQHNLVMANLDRVKLYGDAAKDAIAINSTMRGWKTMASEMAIRTFCSPDSVIRKHLHDAHRVLELLGAPVVTFLAYEDMQLKTLTKINQRQKERIERRTGSADRNCSSSSNINAMMNHRRNASDGSYQHQQHDYTDYPITSLQMDKISLSPSPTPLAGSKVRKATGAEGAIMSLPMHLDKLRSEYASRPRDAKTGFTMREI